MNDIALLQELVQLQSLFGTCPRDIDGYVVSESRRDLLERQFRGLGPVEVDEQHEDGTPGDDDEVVFPPNVHEADGRGLEEDDGCGELAEEGESCCMCVSTV